MHYDQTPGDYGADLVVGPTGNSAHNAGGFTWHSAFNKKTTAYLQLGELFGVTEAAQLQATLAGVRVPIIDEASLVSEEALCEIDFCCARLRSRACTFSSGTSGRGTVVFAVRGGLLSQTHLCL